MHGAVSQADSGPRPACTLDGEPLPLYGCPGINKASKISAQDHIGGREGADGGRGAGEGRGGLGERGIKEKERHRNSFSCKDSGMIVCPSH